MNRHSRRLTQPFGRRFAPPPSLLPRTLCVQFLTILFKLKSQVFEQAVIETPAGLNRLVDLLTSDESICDESVRNEVLLLLTGMVEKSEVVRKLVAFSEGFDRLFSIIEVRMDDKSETRQI